MQEWFVYILKSETSGTYYIGCTSNLERRFNEHNAGHNHSTKRFVPWHLVYKETYQNQRLAYTREKEIKSYKGGNAFKKLIK